ncbi:imidazole glycerol phosphate synthase subunit HisH [Flagellimonas sp.]|uniref:imidazole glycerol phosphate synthase subunit HisH n=1 Tax=Flagellimonas sp. TaxID=2058762 RepID=UPI003AB5AEC7
MDVAIVDYGLSNLSCVKSACERLGHTAMVVSEGEDLLSAKKVILPGVGAFGDAMRNLEERGLRDVLDVLVSAEKIPFLGICLGAQLICKESDEYGHSAGLGWIDAKVRSLDTGSGRFRVPHSGWDDIVVKRDCPLLREIEDASLFYYTHSHAIYDAPECNVVSICDYGTEFVSIMQKDNIYATQFHPEKSQKMGLKLLENFLGL